MGKTYKIDHITHDGNKVKDWIALKWLMVFLTKSRSIKCEHLFIQSITTKEIMYRVGYTVRTRYE